MNKKSYIAVICVLAALTVLFVGLWTSAKNDKSDLYRLAKISAENASANFERFLTSGSDSDYFKGVADFNAFRLASEALLGSGARYTFCNEVYYILADESDACKPNVGQLIEVLDKIAENIQHEGVYDNLANLRSELRKAA